MKRKGINRILGQKLYDLTFHHTHDLDLGVSRSESEITLSQEWDGRLTWNKKDVCHAFMTMILTNVTMVGWADVPNCDQGDFRFQRAVDISSFTIMQLGFCPINPITRWHNAMEYLDFTLSNLWYMVIEAREDDQHVIDKCNPSHELLSLIITAVDTGFVSYDTRQISRTVEFLYSMQD